MGPTHRLFGAVCGAAYGHLTGQPLAMIAMTAIVATSTAHGWSSPDLDQSEPWEAVRKVMPGPAARLMAHRFLTHWWGWPALAWWRLDDVDASIALPLTALLIGWTSHLLGDVIFGQLYLWPWGGPRFGLGLDTGGFIETGKAHVFGRERTILPFGPIKLAMLAGITWLLFAPMLTELTTGAARMIAGT